MGQDFGHGLSGSLKRMSMLVPFSDKGVQSLSEGGLVGKIGDCQLLALQNAEPLLPLVQPRAMHRRMMELEPGMFSSQA